MPTGRVLTIPNLLSLLRLAGVPLFLWLLLGPQADGWAVVVLAVSGFTDYLDGKLARWLNQYSRLGALLDPAVDRLYIVAALLALADPRPRAVVGGRRADRPRPGARRLPAAAASARGYRPFPVTYLGKAATFSLLYAFPRLLLAEAT